MEKRLEAGKKGLEKRTEKDNVDEVGNENSDVNTNRLTVVEEKLKEKVAKLNNSNNELNTTLIYCCNTLKVDCEKNKNENLIKKSIVTQNNDHMKSNFNIIQEDTVLAKTNHERSENIDAINIMIIGIT